MKQQISFILELAYTLSVTLYKYCSHVKRQFYASSWHLVGFILCILVSTYPQKVYTQEAVYVDYIESLNSIPDTNFVSLPILKKEFRLKSNSCISFKIISEANVPDSVTKCLEVAADIWRSCLNLKSNNSINLQLKWEDLPNDEDIKITVAYFYDKDNNYVPTSLYYSLNPDLISENSHDYDAKITINKNINWNCGYNIENNYGSCNLNYAMLRSIAIALGFGSSLSLVNFSSGPVVKFKFSQGHSIFENLLVSENNIWLKNLSNTGKKQNPEIINFCTGRNGNVYIDGNYINASERDKYKMYTPQNYENTKSLVYLDNKQSLMHYSLDKNSTKLQIDSVTIKVLKKLGWNVVAPNVNNVKIKGSDIPESGITSAYTSHLFYIDGEGKDQINNTKWAFYLPTIDGKEALIKSEEGTRSFSIDKICNPEYYANNVNGGIYGKIIFTGQLNNTMINLQYNVTLELKPSISKVTFVKQNNGKDNSYDVVCKVDYKGSDYLYVTLEEEYGSSLRSQFVREPYLAHFVCNNITAPYYAWIDIKAENQYGSDVYTVELPPYYTTRSLPNSISNKTRSLKNNNYTRIKVYNSSGYYIKTIQKNTEIEALQPGIYLLEYIKEGSKIKTLKLVK